MKHICLFLLLLAASCLSAAAGTPLRVQQALARLDSTIALRASFDGQKERIIAAQKQHLKAARNPEERYASCRSIYREYESYKYDSAYVYARRMMTEADLIGRSDYIAEARCSLVFCLFSAGMYKEAFDEAEQLDAAALTEENRRDYYVTMLRLYYAIADYSAGSAYEHSYYDAGMAVADSLLKMLPPKSGEYYYYKGLSQMKVLEYDQGIDQLKHAYADPSLTPQLRAIIASCLGWMSYTQKKNDDAICYFVESAICDIEQATKETTALRDLGKMLYQMGDIKRGIRYVQLSLDDANFYNARQRKLEIGSILPIIEEDRYAGVERERNLLIATVVLMVLLALVMTLAMFFSYRQNRKLRAAKGIIDEKAQELNDLNEELRRTNDVLEQKNAILQENSKIKEEYIANSFFMNAEYLEKHERMMRTVERKAMAQQYDDVKRAMSESTISKDRNTMYAAFDAAFIRLFPTFVDSYNALFPESERKTPSSGQLLTSEMRIFALMRLGITASEKVARFLNYSVHTINTYKTRVKNKALVKGEEFDRCIMEIGH